jgi:hypothetical protein
VTTTGFLTRDQGYSTSGVIVKEKIIYNFPQMITDLESKGKVTVRKSENIFSIDGRYFTYGGKEWAVECLGTKLCRDITNEVIDEWYGVHDYH